MPRRYYDGFDAPPDDRGSGAIFIVILGVAVAVLALGSGWLSVQALMNRTSTSEAGPTATVAAAPTTPAVATPASSATPAPSPTQPARKPVVADWDIPAGHFFTQTNGDQPLASARGYSVTNERGVPFWDAFRQLGGVDAVGYPVSRRFQWQGLETQVFQRAILQWNPAQFRVQIVNVLDVLHEQGKDDLLRDKYLTPPPLPPSFDEGKPFDVVVSSRLALLDPDPTIRAFYNLAGDPMGLYGLPSSAITDMGSNWAIRLQRSVLQRWKTDQPWARAGGVTAANAGELAIQTGLVPSEPLQPEVGQPPAPGTAP